MRKDIHPDYKECSVTCACGNAFVTKSIKEKMTIDICNECHPFFTGSERSVILLVELTNLRKNTIFNRLIFFVPKLYLGTL